eukprot:2752777-Lingulodinium_polyedra.AAC.1
MRPDKRTRGGAQSRLPGARALGRRRRPQHRRRAQEHGGRGSLFYGVVCFLQGARCELLAAGHPPGAA